MEAPLPKLGKVAATTAARLWLVFSFVQVLGVVVWSMLGRSNPLIYDDPHLIAIVFSFVAAGVAFVYCVAEAVARLNRFKHRFTGVALALWCMTLLALEAISDGEGDGLLMLMSLGSVVAGAIAWRLCAIPPQPKARTAISAAGIVALAAYAGVMITMNATR